MTNKTTTFSTNQADVFSRKFTHYGTNGRRSRQSFLYSPRCTYQRAFPRCHFLNVNQVTKGDAHEIRGDPAIWLDIHQVAIATPVWFFIEPEAKQEKRCNLKTFRFTSVWNSQIYSQSLHKEEEEKEEEEEEEAGCVARKRRGYRVSAYAVY